MFKKLQMAHKFLRILLTWLRFSYGREFLQIVGAIEMAQHIGRATGLYLVLGVTCSSTTLFIRHMGLPPKQSVAALNKPGDMTEFWREIKKACIAASFILYGVTDGARTHDNRNHNPGLYQLSYSHHGVKLNKI